MASTIHEQKSIRREDPKIIPLHHHHHPDTMHHPRQTRRRGSHCPANRRRLSTSPSSSSHSCCLCPPSISLQPPSLRPSLAFCLLMAVFMPVSCIAICPSNCTCDDMAYVVQCMPSTIDVMPLTFNPGLQQLTMCGTEIHTLDINSLLWYTDLRHVNLSKNLITNVAPKTFEKQQHLKELHLAQNNISQLIADMFLGLKQLTVLSLRGNVIKSLDGGIFQHLKQLQDLDLSENQIEILDDQALQGLPKLRVLHLQSNLLTAIPALNLALVPDLAELSLGNNKFTEIKVSDFQSVKTLKDLDLSGAKLDGGLSAESFKSLSGLGKLNLEDCGLTSVPTIPLSSLGKLEELHIGRNLFTTLPTHVFRNNRDLHSLDVSGCPNLLHIEQNILQQNLNIEKVIITNNPQLTYIAPDALRFLPELKELDLRYNNLHQVSEDAASWTDIEYWYLDGNPLTCNCSAAWLRTLMLAPNSSSGINCTSPPGLAGKPLHSIHISELACGLDPTTQGVVIAIVVVVLVVMVPTVVLLLLYRHHNNCVHRLLKGHRLGGRGGRYDQPYTHNYHQQAYIMTPTKPVPVTEL